MRHLQMLLPLTFSFILLNCAGSITQLPDTTEIQMVIEVDGLTKDDLYIKSMEWLSRTFKESKSVIDYQDKDAGKIIGNGAISHYFAMIVNGYVLFSVKIELKDSKARITLSNFKAKIVGSTGPPVTRAIMQSEFDAVKPELDSLIANYEQYLKSSTTESDNW